MLFIKPSCGNFAEISPTENILTQLYRFEENLIFQFLKNNRLFIPTFSLVHSTLFIILNSTIFKEPKRELNVETDAKAHQYLFAFPKIKFIISLTVKIQARKNFFSFIFYDSLIFFYSFAKYGA